MLEVFVLFRFLNLAPGMLLSMLLQHTCCRIGMVVLDCNLDLDPDLNLDPNLEPDFADRLIVHPALRFVVFR